jgi:hypothetical protein
MKTFSGISMIALAFRADFRELSTYNGGAGQLWNYLDRIRNECQCGWHRHFAI